MPVSVWRDLIQQHFPNTGWVRLDRPHRRAGRVPLLARPTGLDEAITSLLAENTATREVR